MGESLNWKGSVLTADIDRAFDSLSHSFLQKTNNFLKNMDVEITL